MSDAQVATSSSGDASTSTGGDARKQEALTAYKKALKQHEDLSTGLKKRELEAVRARMTTNTQHACSTLWTA